MREKIMLFFFQYVKIMTKKTLIYKMLFQIVKELTLH